MPKFLYSVIFVTILLWGAVLGVFFGISPDNYIRIFGFLGLLFLALSLTTAIPLYFILNKKNPDFTNKRMFFRKGLKWGVFGSFGVVGILFLMAFDLVNLLNLGLFLLLYVGIFLQQRK